jgi:hypothetical protein
MRDAGLTGITTANAGYPGAWYNLGMGYKDSLDFTHAYESFDRGACLKDPRTENDSLTLNLQALVTPGALVFNQMGYRKSSHYNAANPELLVFEKASLQLVQDNHTVYLAGNLQQFSPERKEPARPMYVALIRTAAFASKDTVSTDKLRLLRAYPNPFNGIITLDFELKEPCRVVTQLLTIDGKVVYSNTAGLLAAGSYTLPIQAPQLAAGYYLLKLQYGNKEKIVKMLKQ